MKVAVLFSGGKDSAFAAFVCQSMGWEVRLLSIEPAEYSTMFHHPNIKWCKKQAEAMGLPIVIVKPRGKSERDELNEIGEALKKMKVDGVVSGAIESEYQKERIDVLAGELGIRSFAPLWRCKKKLLEEQLEYLETYVVAVSAEGLAENMLGRRFDRGFVRHLAGLKHKVSLNLEGGEGETFVADAPFFKKALKINGWKKRWDGARGVAEIASLSRG
ncbi:MAG: diphthine--ammonia ligase [Candidatus Micrarchaeota archaeon]|nr:diphthine--ammonia ligase [Candidatus Micrarchaeota archaeon]